MKKWKIVLYQNYDKRKGIYITDDLDADEADFLPDADTSLLPSVTFEADLPKEFPIETNFYLTP